MVLGDEALVDGVTRALQARGVSVVSPPEPQAPLRPDRGSLDDARQAFEQLEPQHALSQIEAWVEALDRGDVVAGTGDLSDALLLHAQITFALNPELADESIVRARVIEPELQLDPARYPPSFRAAWDAHPPPAPLEVRFEGPVGLRVGVDGQAPGSGPFRLVPGSHWVTCTAPGHHAWRGRIEVAPVVRVELDAEPFAALRGATELHDGVRAAAARLGAAPLLVGRDGSRVWVRDGGDLGRASVSSGPGEARRLVDALFVTRAPPEIIAPPTPRRAWRWVLIGVASALVVAGATTAIVIGTDDDGWEARFRR